LWNLDASSLELTQPEAFSMFAVVFSIGTVYSFSPGEKVGMRGKIALAVIPFTLDFLLHGDTLTCERARVAHRHHPGNPGYRQENRRYAVPSAYSCRLSGRA